VAEREWYRRVLEEPDPERKLRLNAANSRAAKLRLGALLDVVRTGAALDDEVARLWERIQSEFYENQRSIVEGLAASGALAPELSVERATDVLWTLNHPSVWLLLSRERGWSADEYERWFADVSCAQLLR
jgi:hypothetical protein